MRYNKLMQPRPFPALLLVLLVAIAIVNAFAEYYHWYWLMRWFDIPMHFAGGAWVAGVTLWWRFFSGRFTTAPLNKKAIFVWAMIGEIGIGLAWEAYEAIISCLTVGRMNDVLDTIGDLIFDILGGLVSAVTLWVYTYKKQ